MQNEGTILSIQVGRPQQFSADDVTHSRQEKPWTSGIIKRPVHGSLFVGRLNIEGDEQADLQHHGGCDKAVLGYAARHYIDWKQDLPDVTFSFGAFGENLTISGLDETTCCVGDVFEIGDCRLQISQPRQPCWKLNRRWNMSNLAVVVQKTGRTGWYYRVLQEGMIEPGMPIRLADPHFQR